MILATLVDWNALGKVAFYSFIAAVGVTTVFSVAIVGLARYDDRRRNSRGGGAAWAALAGVCSLIVAAVVVEAIVVMTNK